MQKILAIDYGDKRVGLAIGDLEIKTAVPFGILEYTDQDELLEKLKKIISQEKIEKIVLGLPLSLHNNARENSMQEKDYENAHMKKYLAFKKIVEKHFDLPVITEDERMSTKMARGLGNSKKKKRKERYDDVAAMVILQGYLDRGDRQK